MVDGQSSHSVRTQSLSYVHCYYSTTHCLLLKTMTWGALNFSKESIQEMSHPSISWCITYHSFGIRKPRSYSKIHIMLGCSVIQSSSNPWASHSQWCYIVQKNDGSLRFCINYRKVNAVTRKDNTLDTLARFKWFSTL